jgi:hypothetical protein
VSSRARYQLFDVVDELAEHGVGEAPFQATSPRITATVIGPTPTMSVRMLPVSATAAVSWLSHALILRSSAATSSIRSAAALGPRAPAQPRGAQPNYRDGPGVTRGQLRFVAVEYCHRV